jgi:hypothetical protein
MENIKRIYFGIALAAALILTSNSSFRPITNRDDSRQRQR